MDRREPQLPGSRAWKILVALGVGLSAAGFWAFTAWIDELDQYGESSTASAVAAAAAR